MAFARMVSAPDTPELQRQWSRGSSVQSAQSEASPTERLNFLRRSIRCLSTQLATGGICVSCVPCGACITSSSGSSGDAKVDKSPADARRWYRVHPVGDLSYYVRRDVGPVGHPSLVAADLTQSPTYPQMVLQSRRSTPNFLERTVGLTEPEGFERDAFSNDCKVCFEKPSEVVLLPCRHGGLCEDCYRSALFSRPVHRGGRSCPFCRKTIREAVQFYHLPGEALQYGYGIKVF
mmetsp:Transcript_102082/g.284191  ORF Transcript_102082/g.284191 Transcript_102082/m.284191 type:complete len:234 (-) Transcript_102082:222-923(-)